MSIDNDVLNAAMDRVNDHQTLPLSERRQTEEAYRALIVRKLRAEADRIEAGGSPACYGRGLDDVEACIDIVDARALADYDCDDEWPEEIEDLHWGVVVEVEAMVCTWSKPQLRGASHDYLARYELADPDTHTGPVVEDAECRACGWTGPVPENEEGRLQCPACSSEEGSRD